MTGDLNVSGTLISYTDWGCKLINNTICCIHNKEGGQYGSFKRKDNSTTKECYDLVTKETTFVNNFFEVNKIDIRGKVE